MFHNVNGEDRADCQNDQRTFYAMRDAQYSEWSEETLESYLADMEKAESEGRNLAREKYIRMMKSTDPGGYEAFKKELPKTTEMQRKLVEEIWQHMQIQTERMQGRYPILALGGRPLYARDEIGTCSIETYQTGELLTYSEQTLEAYLKNLIALEEAGVDLLCKIQENSITCMGYKSMEEAETALSWHFLQMMGATEGCSGGNCFIN